MRMLPGAAGLLAVLAAVGCGSSGGGNEPAPATSKGLQTVEIGNISAAPTNEGEQVTVTLPVTNSTGNALSYDWTVTFAGQPITFSGQNTNTIRFTAPQVDGDSSVQVSVELDLVGGELVGRNEVYSSVRIIDTNPNRVNQVAGDAFLNKGAEVAEFDLSALPELATWRYSLYSMLDINIDESDATLHYSVSGTGHTERGSNESYGWEYCGESFQFTTVANLLQASFVQVEGCTLDNLVEKKFQNGNNLYTEHYCGNQLVSARALQYLEEGKVDYGTLEVLVEGGSNYVDGQACVDFERHLVIDSNNASGAYSEITIYGEMGGSLYDIALVLDGINYQEGVEFFTATTENSLNAFSMGWSELGDFSGLEQDFGTFTINSVDQSGNYSAEFDVRLSKGTFDNLNIEGSIEVSLP